MKRHSMAAVIVTLTALLQGTPAARADEASVQYLVDAKALKAAVAGTMLTFGLYFDSACSSMIYSQVVNAEDLDLIEKLKTLKIKGDTTPPAKTARLQHVLTSAPSVARYFATVTGTGIIPIGGACQPQVSLGPATFVTGGVLVSVPLDLGGTSGSGAGFTYSCTRDNGFMTPDCTCIVTFALPFVGAPVAFASVGTVASLTTTTLILTFTDFDVGLSGLAFSVLGQQ